MSSNNKITEFSELNISFTYRALPQNNQINLRKSQSIVGRELAREALKLADFPGEAPLTKGQLGAPEWPTGFVGSISHCKTLAGAIAAKSSAYLAVGLDIEKADRTTKTGLIDRICNESEKAVGFSPLEFFSAKEACFKALRPMTTKTFAFKEIKLARSDTDKITFQLAADHKTFNGNIILISLAEHIITTAYIKC